jgi:hypothetical protein
MRRSPRSDHPRPPLNVGETGIGWTNIGGCAMDDAATDDQVSSGEAVPTPDVVQVPKELSVG